MSKRILNEASEEELLSAAIQKSLSSAPLTIEEYDILNALTVGDLIIEQELTYDEANKVAYWMKNEKQRITDEYLYQRTGEWDPRGVRPGSPGLIESKKTTTQQLRHFVRCELRKTK
jgi:hypothetical protein